jgi:CHAT domain-containing protein
LIKASSDIYAQHFSLVADRFNNPRKAYEIVEQVRGRVATDLLMAGSIASEEAKKTERAIAELRLKLMAARSTADVRKIRDQIFLVEQARWVTPEVNILKTRSAETIELERVQKTLAPTAVILEYVVANPKSYCLVISRSSSRIVPLPGKDRFEELVGTYLKAVKANEPGRTEARRLYDAMLLPVPEAASKESLVVIRDGHLHLVPFDALLDAKGRYVAERHTVMYAPSATSFYLLAQRKGGTGSTRFPLLGVGGIPYSGSNLSKAFPTIRSGAGPLSDLPSSTDEVRSAESALKSESNTLLLGEAATEAAFKRQDLTRYRVLHLAVHGVADTARPDRAALVFLSDPAKGEDGLLQATEIVQLKLNADLVVLSACDTAVGPLQGQEGVAALSRAFLLAGSTNVVSTLWAIDDTVSLSVMQLFYKHLAAKKSAAVALTTAKRDILKQFGRDVMPYFWAGFTFEGVADGAISVNR